MISAEDIVALEGDTWMNILVDFAMNLTFFDFHSFVCRIFPCSDFNDVFSYTNDTWEIAEIVRSCGRK